MQTAFLFVDSGGPDREAKRQMRRHVMKGKNVGKKLHRPSRLDLATGNQAQSKRASIPSSIREGRQSTQAVHASGISSRRLTFPKRPSSVGVDRRFGDDFQAFGVPVGLSRDSKQVVDEFFSLTTERMYPVQIGLSTDEGKFVWLKTLFQERSACQCNIAVMKACNEVFLGRDGNSPEALHHLSQAFSEVQKRLNGPDALKDSTLTIILMLVLQQQLLGDHTGAKVHVEGLRRMVELRGGVDALQPNLPLVLKICKSDVMFALQFGGKPRFYKDPMAEIYEHCQSLGLHLDRELAAATTQHRGEMHPTLYDVLVDMKVVSSVFNGHLGKVKVELHMFTRLMLSTCYRLLQFQALDGPPLVSNLDAVHYAGMMMFILTVFLRYDSRRIIECDLMSQCLEATIQRRLGEAYHELELWLLVIGGIWASAGGDDDGDWIIPRIVPMAQKMGLYTWGEVRGCIGNFPWINGIHDKPGQKLWKRLQKTL